MTRSTFTLAGVIVVLALAGCASQPSAPAAQQAAAAPAPATAPATAAPADAALAAKLKGNWTGKWELAGFGSGKFELIVADAQGSDVKGNANWYGTAAGDTKAPLDTATVKNGQLVAKQGSATIKLSAKDDNTLSGTWENSGFSGPLTVKR